MKRILHAGDVQVNYQNGFIRYISSGGVEIIRMINHALRDQNWGTIPMEITKENIREFEDGFQISYKAACEKGDISFLLSCQITGTSDGTIQFTYRGVAQSDFKRNRIGFTVLHPIESCAGKDVKIVHGNGTETHSPFPKSISPHQPFKDIREMHWKPSFGQSASLYFSGEVFETEDQRNWTDASYKTYCTPLGIPFPASVQKGEEIIQKITLKVSTIGHSKPNLSEKPPVTIRVKDQALPVPEWGTQATSTLSGKISMKVMEVLQPRYLRIDFSLDRRSTESLNLLIWANKHNIPVELALFTDQASPLETLKKLKPELQSVIRILLFGDTTKTTPGQLLECVKELRKLLPQVEIYGGTDAFFTELNRERIDAKDLEGVSYTINPQVHAFDDQSLIETLPAQGYTVESAKHLYPDKKIAVSPVNFHMRWNPNATEPGKHLRTPTGWVDERQYTLFGACWFLFSLKYLTEAGASSITYFEWEGENGWVKATENGIERSPMAEIWNKFNSFSSLNPTVSSDPLTVDTMVFSDHGKSILLIVNWTQDEQAVQLPAGFVPISYWQEADGKLTEYPAKNAAHSIYQVPSSALFVAEKNN